MNITSAEIESLVIIEPTLFIDNRGAFYETWRSSDYEKYGITEPFLQDNISISKRNVLRGLHFQRNQGQLVTVVQGAIWDVVVDIRPNSKTFKQYFSIELNSNNPKQLYMPSGFAHGFLVLTEVAIVHYKCTQYYDATQEGGIIWNDPSIGIPWPKIDIIVSEKDSKFKSMGE